MSLTTYTSPIREQDVEKIRAILEEAGFDFKEKPYAHFSAKKPGRTDRRQADFC